ncbi:MAG: type II CRISPR-associated endonuclease Cas1 [Clostridia bacterium]|nr:type II CRISPR-associated endonuclease Cas1 [Clostridia bacterium]
MSFINVFIENTCSVSTQNGSLLLKSAEKQAVYPIEDINCVMIDCLYVNASVYTLNKLCESGATVIVCDERHLPSCTLMPFNKYYKKLSVLNKQLSISKPKIKGLWQAIIRKKINNQADCLTFNGKSGGITLAETAKTVLSGDADNAEARAAAFYFKNLFGKDFSRNEENFINGCLNYCYSIVRAILCRHLAARGFECSIGIFHKNQFNNFNLADDLIEPFRPLVDNFVYNVCKGHTEIAEIKKTLFGIVNLNVKSGTEIHGLSNAAERFVESVLGFYNGANEKLCFPEIYDLTAHAYE